MASPDPVKLILAPAPDKVKTSPVLDRVNAENVGVPEVVISCAALRVTDPPRDTEPPPVRPVPAVTVREELTKLELVTTPDGRVTDPPLTTNPPLNTPRELKVAVPPTPTLPVKSDNPLTLKPPLLNVNPVVVRDAPTPVFPETVRVDPYAVPKEDVPDTFKLVAAIAALVPVTVRDVPTPKFPEINPAPDIPRVAPDMDLVTDRESSTDADETVREVPTPTLPDTERDDPIPTKPVNNPVPDTFKL